MKKFSKLLLVVLTLTMCSNVLVALPNGINTFAGLSYSNVGAILEIATVPTEGALRTPITIPNGEAYDDDLNPYTVTVTVYNPRNKILLDTEFTIGEDTRTFTPNLIGTYRVVYTVDETVDEEETALASTISEEYQIVVSSAIYTLSFADNSEYIIPSTTNRDYDIILPNPDVLDEEEEIVPLVERAPVTITVVDPQYDELEMALVGEESDQTKLHVNTDGYTYFRPTLTGQYTITYTYQDDNATSVSKTYTVDVRNSYEPDDINLGYQFNSTMPATATLGVEVELPTVRGIDRDNSNATVSISTEIVIEFIDTSSGTTQYVSTGYAVGDANREDMFSFIPAQKGNYRIKYTITDFFGHVSGPNYYYVNNVKDSQAPQDLQLVLPYTVTEGVVDEDALESAVNRVPTKFDLTYTNISGGTEAGRVAFPAVYATDNVTEYEDLNFSVKLVKSSTSFTTYLYNYDADEGGVNENSDTNTNVYYDFTTADTYTLTYTVTDEEGYSTSLSYTLTVVSSLGDLPEPKITAPSVPANVTPDQTVQLLKPTAVDYDGNNTENESNVIDRALVVESSYSIYYYVGDVKTYIGTEDVEILEDEDNTSYLSFVVPTGIYDTVPVDEEIFIDFTFYTLDNHSQSATVLRTAEVLNVETTSVPSFVTDPTVLGGDYVTNLTVAQIGTYFNFEVDFDGEVEISDFEQFNSVAIPDVSFTDSYDKQLSIKIIVRDENGNTVATNGTVEYDTVGANYVATIVDASFMATKNGVYNITFIATNIGGNTLIRSFELGVLDKEIPVITVTNVPSTIELGTTVTLPKAVIYDGGVELEDANTWIVITVDSITSNPNGSTAVWQGYNFTPLAEGNFRVKYYATDDSDNYAITREFVISVEDTVSPVIVIGEGQYTNTDGSLPNKPLVTSGDTYEVVTIPSFTASDLYGINWEKTKINVKDADGTKLTTTETDTGYTFVPTGDGTYTIIYTATDYSNNVTTVTKTLIVGDTISPEITIGNADSNLPESKEVGDSLILDLAADVAFVNDNKDGDFDITSSNFSVTLIGPDSTTISPIISSNGYKYTYALDEAGSYTITYTATDEAGNTESQTHSFQVTVAESEPVISTTVWGTVLIIVSVLVLAGVVIYFVKTGKKTAKK
ncbi:MAG: hypothetical protein PHO33_00175 [Clostridia bacterium]|nr:hypothetical protein [Clostridia bacterium]